MINKDYNHVVTLIDGVVYDINGECDIDEYYYMSDEDIEEAETWSFASKNILSLCECPYCEEPIMIPINSI